MRLRKGYEVTTSHGDTIIVHGAMTPGTIKWARRNGYVIKRVKVLV